MKVNKMSEQVETCEIAITAQTTFRKLFLLFQTSLLLLLLLKRRVLGEVVVDVGVERRFEDVGVLEATVEEKRERVDGDEATLRTRERWSRRKLLKLGPML